MPLKYRLSIILALALGLGLVSVFCSVHWITPAEMTRTAMVETFVRINLYAEEHKILPTSLNTLPTRKGYDNRTTDGWNRPLQYSVAADGVITLKSFGADGKPGGDGKNADISQSYHSKRPDGSLWVGSAMWIVEAECK